MNSIFHLYLDKFVLIFIDDNLVYSRSLEEHKEHLWIILQILRENQLYAKYNKCDFYKDQIQYLGHIISSEGISVHHEKIKTIMEWPTARNVANIHSFMGLSGYYRHFIERFSRITYPITSLQKKGRSFKRKSECQRSFEQLKNLLIKTLVLKVTDPEKEFTVYADASEEDVGGVLMQEGRIIAYESRKLKYHEHRYQAYHILISK